MTLETSLHNGLSPKPSVHNMNKVENGDVMAPKFHIEFEENGFKLVENK